MNKPMQSMIEAYILNRQDAWSETTLASERHRLNGMAPALSSFNAEKLWAALQEHGAYTRSTMFSRAASFYDWLMEQGHVAPGLNPYRTFRKRYAKKFKNTYVKRQPEISYEEAEARLGSIPEADVRAYALALLKGGLRAAEFATYDGRFVTGKGGKSRRVYLPGVAKQNSESAPSYYRLYRACRRVGIKPHDARKLFASRLVEKGANEFELTKMMGWASLNTASSYVRTNESRMEALARNVQGGTTNGTEQAPGDAA